jgi:hypothetical protein
MFIRQISVNLDNVPGKLQGMSQLLGAERINIRAISIVSTSDTSTVRLVADDPVKTINILKASGYSAEEADVVVVKVPDHPGGLQAILKPLEKANINVLYLYSHLGRAASGNTIVILGVDKTKEAIEVLKENWVYIFGKEAYTL